jgi:predicted AlkP superfamily pyrophosphatase or phosphodiesterase
MKSFILSVISSIALGFATLASAQETRPTATTSPAREKQALIISVDGLRPDVLLRADAPHIRALANQGSFTYWARSTVASVTLPTHVSLLTGVTPEGHGIVWNGELPLSEPVYPRVPTIFELAKKAGYTTGAVTGKSKFKVLAKPGTIDFAYYPDESKSTDEDVASHARQIIQSHRPGVMFVHFPGVDNAGHAKGWGTREQLDAVAVADKCVGMLLDTLEELKLRESTLIVLTADHGGSGRTHGSEDFRSRHIPWIAVGPGIRKNYDLTMNRDLVVEVYDTFTTVCTLLDIPIGRKVNGKMIEDILDQRELLKPKG